jgi:hypothetical protein
MARKPQRNNYLFIVGVGVAVIVAFLLTLGVAKESFSKNDFNKCVPFPVESYLEGEALWSNTDYVITGTFQNILLKQQSSDCTLCSVVTEEKKIPLPIIFTPSAAKTPLQREQKIKVLVRVEGNGRIIASNCMIQ